MRLQVWKKIKLNSTIMVRLTKLWETVTFKTEEMFRMKLTKELVCSSEYLFLVTQSQRKSVWDLGFVFLAVPALRSGDCIETCGIYLEKQFCRCNVLPDLHETFSILSRLFDVKDVTTQSRDLKRTKCLHVDLTRSTTKWETMCSRSLTQSACVSRS